jgi:hypothetical protein
MTSSFSIPILRASARVYADPEADFLNAVKS